MSPATVKTKRMMLVSLPRGGHLEHEVELDGGPEVMRYLGDGRVAAGRECHAAVRTSIGNPVSRSETCHSVAIAVSMPSLRRTGLRTGGPLLTNRGP